MGNVNRYGYSGQCKSVAILCGEWVGRGRGGGGVGGRAGGRGAVEIEMGAVWLCA